MRQLAGALLGGLVVVSASESDLLYTQVSLPPLRVVVAVPDFALLTQEARAILPATISTSFQGAAQAFQASLQGLGLLLVVRGAGAF